ncbi:MAG: deoxynucleoside kinase [Nitrospinae bacterium]|nr:deoxynucleoside kinase [Nitrospinota bacterium]
MKRKARYIAVEGPIGVGKTSLVHSLCRKFGVEPVLEDLEDNPFLERFYKDQANYAFHTQVAFLISRHRQLAELKQVDLFNRLIFSDYIFERDMVFARLNLNQNELRLYSEIYRILQRDVPKPDLVIYLQCDTPTLMRRIRARARDMERTVPEEYIEKVNGAFNEFFFNYREGPLLIINTSHIDFVMNDDDLEKVSEKIFSDVKGQEYYNPLGSV